MSVEYMTTQEVAELCRTSPETVRWWRHVGKGPQSFRVGRRVLYPRGEVSRWLQSFMTEPTSTAALPPGGQPGRSAGDSKRCDQ